MFTEGIQHVKHHVMATAVDAFSTASYALSSILVPVDAFSRASLTKFSDLTFIR
jgi:hypothetical protein